MTKQEFIFTLIRSGLWQQKIEHFDMTPFEYKAVMVEAEKQCVAGLVIDCLRMNNMGLQKKCVIHMMKVHNSLKLENKRLDDNVITLHHILNDKGIEYVVVKGQVVGSLYPKPHMRVPGDIDFYVPPKFFQNAVDALNEKWDVNLDGSRKKMHLAFKYNGNNFEMHRYLKYFPNKKRLKRFNDIIDRYPFDELLVSGTKIKTLNPTLNVFYTFVHLYGHFIKLGVALRQLCDLAILLHELREQIDDELLLELLRQFGYTRAFKAIGSIMVDQLGLPATDFPLQITSKDKRMGIKVLRLIWKHGNWGEYERSYKKSDKNFTYFWEKTYYRVYNQILFFQLSPKENFTLLFSELPKKAKKQVQNLKHS